ncbi:macrolide transport system ATP-binding/permease protein [Spinactinospora alkalitolerans]|uniref:Macrolide transport system ATP-binding/permease protein n=1 Tax=Spinactinospora alkalitolerans TaxID=687207 RepID=A0A852TVJ1_9ACTN|nr:ABC-F family ATP-binding cassette domain-containing protein [Spinactinospora alkalitolerans]NYE47317.1 macrolide transport system ATP-binding/permease protein [Spinactinospora alkalitolerans]
MPHSSILLGAPADAGSAPVLRARDLAKAYGAHPVFDGLSLDVAPGHRLGLVGENGAGKSTLLRLLAGVEDADAGEVARPRDIGFGHQEVPYPDEMTLAEVVEEALAGSRAIERRLTEQAEALNDRPGDAALLAAYGETLEEAEGHDVWDADRRAEVVLAGLDLAGIERERRPAEMSGGERARLGLAALLVRRPRALLLDEPTNHLDDDAVEFLQSHLRALPGAVVLASHDRVFLDEVCTGILDLDPSRSGPACYGGAYTHYLREKKVERQRWEQQWSAEQDRLRRLRQSVRSTARQVGQFRPMKDGNKVDYDGMGKAVQKQISRRVRNARRRLAELERDQVRKPPRPLSFDSALTGGTAAGGSALIARGIEVPDRLALDRLDLPVDGRLLVTGPNGAGKSTLLQVLARRLEPGAGSVRWRCGITVALLEQDVGFRRPELTPRRLYAAMTAASTGPPALAELGLVAPRDIDRPVGVLSVGQRRRFALALLVAAAPQVLLLDEPTNHISLALADELEEALRTAPGAVVAATHDRWLRRGWDGPRLHLVAGRAAEEVNPRRKGSRSTTASGDGNGR